MGGVVSTMTAGVVSLIDSRVKLNQSIIPIINLYSGMHEAQEISGKGELTTLEIVQVTNIPIIE